MGRRPKIREKGQFPTDLGIDRLHPEPKNDFLGSGTPKNTPNQQKTLKNIENGVGVWANFVAGGFTVFFRLKGLPIRPWGVGGLAQPIK